MPYKTEIITIVERTMNVLISSGLFVAIIAINGGVSKQRLYITFFGSVASGYLFGEVTMYLLVALCHQLGWTEIATQIQGGALLKMVDATATIVGFLLATYFINRNILFEILDSFKNKLGKKQ